MAPSVWRTVALCSLLLVIGRVPLGIAQQVRYIHHRTLWYTHGIIYEQATIEACVPFDGETGGKFEPFPNPTISSLGASE